MEKFEFKKPGEVRTRFAPSPTGVLHIGGARTALFNYLFAKKNKGSFVLRIEDTDKERSKEEFTKEILNGLKWLNIQWDEGPDQDGEYGPYYQSKRSKIYADYIKKLLDEKRAYFCFCTKEELEAKKQYQMSQGLPPKYNGKCSKLSDEEIEKNLKEGKSCIIRFKVPEKKVIFKDLIRGEVEFDTSLIGDFSIAKDLETPLYNLAVAVDDHEMKITHIIRGEDHISNTPKQILLQEALGFEKPYYAHLPLILGPDKSKLSKRHGAVAVTDYRQEGYLPEAIINFLAFLGWNPGDEREIYSMSSLIKDFTTEKVQKSGAVFNLKKLDYLNGFYIRQKSLEKITELCMPYLIQDGLIQPIFDTKQYPPAYGGQMVTAKYKVVATGEDIDASYIQKAVSLYQERLKKLSEISELVRFLFIKELDYDKQLLFWKDMTKEELVSSLDSSFNVLDNIKEWTKKNIEKELLLETERIGDRGKLLWPLRVSLTGQKASAGPFEVAEVLGKKESLKRIEKARELIKKPVE